MNEEKYQRLLRQRRNRTKAKQNATLEAAVARVKKEARLDTWCSTHANCFRASMGKGESEVHVRKKFELFLEYRKAGATVFTELRWRNGSRSDLVVCWHNGEVEIVEVAVSEKGESLIQKGNKYPFPMKVVRMQRDGQSGR